MAVDPTLFDGPAVLHIPSNSLLLPTSPIAAQPVTATVQATAPTARQAAAAVQDVAGGIVQDLNKDASTNVGPYRTALLIGVSVAGAYLLLLFGYLVGDWIGTGNARASSMLLGLNSYATPLLAALVAYGAGLWTPVPKK